VFLATGAVVIVAEGVILFPSTIVHEVDTHAIVLQTFLWRFDAHVCLSRNAVQWLSCACEEEKACHYSLAHN